MSNCTRSISTAIIVALAIAASGCTHTQLRWNTVQQSGTIADIHQQQVLNNLARFVDNYNALPSFSFPNQGGSNVTDQGTAGVTPGFGRTAGNTFLLNALGLSFGAQRNALESFTMTPVNDPRKLELMRCAYQHAVATCGYGPASETCPDCPTIFKKFYTGDPNGDIRSKANGIVTSECLNLTGSWFCTGSKKCVPRNCSCNYVGCYCDTYVWVMPEGRDELTKLTLAILDYANNSPPVGLMKQVAYYIDEFGLPTSSKLAVGQVMATVAIDEQNASLLSMSQTDELRIEEIIQARLNVIEDRIDEIREFYPELAPDKANDNAMPKALNELVHRIPTPIGQEYGQLLDERLSLKNKLAYLQEQLRTPGLKQEYSAPSASPAQGGGLLQLNQMQTILTAPGR